MYLDLIKILHLLLLCQNVSQSSFTVHKYIHDAIKSKKILHKFCCNTAFPKFEVV